MQVISNFFPRPNNTVDLKPILALANLLIFLGPGRFRSVRAPSAVRRQQKQGKDLTCAPAFVALTFRRVVARTVRGAKATRTPCSLAGRTTVSASGTRAGSREITMFVCTEARSMSASV
jgi:hypothetical protein